MLDVFTHHLQDGSFLRLTFLDEGIHTSLEIHQGFSHCRVEHQHRGSAVGFTTDSTELKTVSCESERTRSVAVSIVDEQFWNGWKIQFECFLSSHREVIIVSLLHMFEQVCHRLAQEGRNDGRRSFIGTQTMCVGRTHDRSLQESVMVIHSLQRLDNERDETQVVHRSLAWCMEQNTRVGSQRPVLMLTRTVHTLEGFLVQQATETVLTCHTLHDRHHQHVVVHSQIRLFKDRCQLKLIGSHLVMACLARDTQLQSLNLDVLHELLHTGRDGTEVVIIHLLILGRVMSHQRATCHHEVRTCSEK